MRTGNFAALRSVRAIALPLSVFGILGMTAPPPALADNNAKVIKEALSAAPARLKKTAAVHDWKGNVLRKGSSNYVCYPRLPGSKVANPMCFDKPWMAWGDAYMKKTKPNVTGVGVSYMLAGDGGASNIDPFAQGPTKDNQWVKEGPHLMLLVPDSAALEEISTDPKNGGPYVMWKGTPYAHIMVPLK